MPTVSGFSAFASIPDEEVSDKITRRIVSGEKGMIVWWSIAAGVHVAAHRHEHEQIVWMLKGRMEFRLPVGSVASDPHDGAAGSTQDRKHRSAAA